MMGCRWDWWVEVVEVDVDVGDEADVDVDAIVLACQG